MSISKKYQKDYSNAKFDNPRLVKVKENRMKRFRKFIYALFVVFFFGLLYIFFYSPFFEIKNFQINGLEKVRKENIEKIINDYQGKRNFLIFSRNNFWNFDKNELVSEFNKYYVFENLEIKKKLPDGVIINLVEKQSAINWLVGDLCYHLDMTGTAIEYCEGGNGLLTIKDVGMNQIDIGDVAIYADDLKYLVELNEQGRNILKDKFQPIIYEKNKNAVTAKMESGPEIRFNTNIEVGDQVSRLDLLLKEAAISEQFLQMNYIDLRFGEKVFYK